MCSFIAEPSSTSYKRNSRTASTAKVDEIRILERQLKAYVRANDNTEVPTGSGQTHDGGFTCNFMDPIDDKDHAQDESAIFCGGYDA